MIAGQRLRGAPGRRGLSARAGPSVALSLLRLAGSLWWYWYLRGHYAEARQWLERRGCSTVHEVRTSRGDILVAMAREYKADGVLFLPSQAA